MDVYQPAAPWRDAPRLRRALAPRRPSRGRVVVRLFLPLTPIVLLLSPFAVLVALLCIPAAPLLRVNPLAAALATGRVLLALGGTDITIDTRDAFVRLRIV
jgi:hypothetical protein